MTSHPERVPGRAASDRSEPLRALLLGPPGAGKGTQSDRLARRYGVPHLSPGAMLRQEVETDSPIGRQVAEAMADGMLLPDDLLSEFVLGRLEALGPSVGYVLDGFPRTVPQAEALDSWGRAFGTTPAIAIWLGVPDEELRQRLVARGARLRRADDAEVSIERRLALEADASGRLRDFYRRLGNLVELNGEGTADEVGEQVWRAVASRVGRARS